MRIQMKSLHGTYRFSKPLDNSTLLIFTEPIASFCGLPTSCLTSSGLGACCNVLPSALLSLEDYLQLPLQCSACIQQQAVLLATSTGVHNCTFYSSLSAAQSALSRVQYQVVDSLLTSIFHRENC